MLKFIPYCRLYASFGLIALVSTGCTLHFNLYSTAWVLDSAEYEAATQTVYNSAINKLAGAKADSTWTAALEQKQDLSDPMISNDLKPAVILDIDETVLNNAGYQARLISKFKNHSSERWDKWISEARATALVGVVEYVTEAKRQGIAVIYVTNRACKERAGNDDACPQRTDTILNLESAGLPPLGPDDLVLLRNQQTDWTGEKNVRRSFVCEKYRILQIFGDNLYDFVPPPVPVPEPGKDEASITSELRKEYIQQYQDNWGSKWFMLPNPMYGSWLNVISDNPKNN